MNGTKTSFYCIILNESELNNLERILQDDCNINNYKEFCDKLFKLIIDLKKR